MSIDHSSYGVLMMFDDCIPWHGLVKCYGKKLRQNCGCGGDWSAKVCMAVIWLQMWVNYQPTLIDHRSCLSKIQPHDDEMQWNAWIRKRCFPVPGTQKWAKDKWDRFLGHIWALEAMLMSLPDVKGFYMVLHTSFSSGFQIKRLQRWVSLKLSWIGFCVNIYIYVVYIYTYIYIHTHAYTYTYVHSTNLCVYTNMIYIYIVVLHFIQYTKRLIYIIVCIYIYKIIYIYIHCSIYIYTL